MGNARFVGWARERADAPILSLTPHIGTARMLTVVWSVHSVQSEEIERVSDVVNDAAQIARTDALPSRELGDTGAAAGAAATPEPNGSLRPPADLPAAGAGAKFRSPRISQV